MNSKTRSYPMPLAYESRLEYVARTGITITSDKWLEIVADWADKLNAVPADWTRVEKIDDAPNPVLATRSVCDGGTARLYADGHVDAIDGQVYSLSMGFDSFEELESWVRLQHRKLNP